MGGSDAEPDAEAAPAAKRPRPEPAAAEPAAAKDKPAPVQPGAADPDLEEPDNHRAPRPWRCRPKRDSGATRGSAAGVSYFCLDFARGVCGKGADCALLHRVPTRRDDLRLSLDYDIFGRPRAEIGEPGAAKLSNCSLYAGGLLVPERERSRMCGGTREKPLSAGAKLDKAVRKAFGAWGEILETKIVLHSRVAFVTFAARSAAEFAREAMFRQPLRAGLPDALNIKWLAGDRPTREAGGYTFDMAEEAVGTLEELRRWAWGRHHSVLGIEAAAGGGGAGEAAAGAGAAAGAVAGAATEAAAGAEAAAGGSWTELRDASTGFPYWWHTGTNAVTWRRPTSI